MASPVSHDPSLLQLPDLLVPQICPALSLPFHGLHVYTFFSAGNALSSLFFLVNPNLIHIKCHFLLEALGQVFCIYSQHHNFTYVRMASVLDKELQEE